MVYNTQKLQFTVGGKAIHAQSSTRQPIIANQGNGYNRSLQPTVPNAPAVKNPWQRQRG